MKDVIAIILAAGKSTRMKTRTPKVLHEVCGVPMLDYVLEACREAGAGTIYIVVGYGKEQIIEQYGNQADLVFVPQDEQKGTGHAVLCCREHIGDFDGDTLVLCGDGPMIRGSTLSHLVGRHRQHNNALTLGTAMLDDPFGYGRIVRDATGAIVAIVEHADCTEEQLAIKEANPSYLCFDNRILFSSLDRITPDNAKGEYYLTEAIGIILGDGHSVEALNIVARDEALSVNSREQLSELNAMMQTRIQTTLMQSGVTVVNPETTWISPLARIGQDTIIEPLTCIKGRVEIGNNCRIGPLAILEHGAVLKNGTIHSGHRP